MFNISLLINYFKQSIYLLPSQDYIAWLSFSFHIPQGFLAIGYSFSMHYYQCCFYNLIACHPTFKGLFPLLYGRVGKFWPTVVPSFVSALTRFSVLVQLLSVTLIFTVVASQSLELQASHLSSRSITMPSVNVFSFFAVSPHFSQHRGIESLTEYHDDVEIHERDYSVIKRTLFKLETKYNFSSSLKGINEIHKGFPHWSICVFLWFYLGLYLPSCLCQNKGKIVRRVVLFYFLHPPSILLSGLIEDSQILIFTSTSTPLQYHTIMLALDNPAVYS